MDKPGHYFAGEDSLHPDVKREIAGSLDEIDQEQIEIYKRISPAQKFYQACSIINLAKKVSLEKGQVKKTKHIRDIGSTIKTRDDQYSKRSLSKSGLQKKN